MQSRTSPRYAMYLAVLPSYRDACVQVLRSRFGNQLELIVSDSHLDRSVKTGISSTDYRRARMIRFGQLAFLQVGHWRAALSSDALIVDLNPRSVTAWALLLMRRPSRRKRTIVWGHLFPRSGAEAPTSVLRRFMRRLADGTLSYTHRDRTAALAELPDQPVWVAANALYKKDSIRAATSIGARTNLLYVGRFEPAKHVDRLVRAMPQLLASHEDARLVLIGDGRDRYKLESLASSLGVAESVDFPGWINDPSLLAEHYARAFASASPGFAGLGLTQSLGFGVPMIVSRNELHSPEIELEETGFVYWFDAATEADTSLASVATKAWARSSELPATAVTNYVRDTYSAEAMADGIISAFNGPDTK